MKANYQAWRYAQRASRTGIPGEIATDFALATPEDERNAKGPQRNKPDKPAPELR